MWTTALMIAVLAQLPAETSSPAFVRGQSPSEIDVYSPDYGMTSGFAGSNFGFENFLPRIGVQHRSEGYGYDSGYTSLDTFVPIFQQDFAWMTAFQGSFLIDNHGDLGFIAGLVQRKYVESWDRVVGVNSFYNNREQGGNQFHQVGFGVETLGNYLDWRANSYIPVGEDLQAPESGGGITEAFFSNRSILVNFIADKPLTGFDTEIGGTIPSSLEIFRAYGGLYHFEGDYSESATGIQGRLEARLRDRGVASVALTHDGLFGTNVVLGIGLWWPGTSPRNGSPYGRASTRMAEDVVRNQMIVIDRSATRDPVQARWTNGTVMDVVHVSSNAPVAGTGTPGSPVQTLAEAQSLATPQSLIFVHANTQYTGEGIVLQAGQSLLGEGLSHQVQSLYGPFLLPNVTPLEDIISVPLISNAPGTAVTLANSTTVSGFRITGSGSHGVAGNGVNQVTLDRLNIVGSAQNGVQLLDASGPLQVTENFINGNAGRGIEISTSSAATVNNLVLSGNTLLSNEQEGIAITTNGQSTNTLVMEQNLVRIGLGPLETRNVPLVNVTTLNSSTLSARVENNDIEDTFARDSNSPDEDPYYQQLTLTAADSSRVDIGFINNRLASDRAFLLGNPRNGSFGLDLNSTNLAVLRARLENNSSTLNYAFSENFISTFQLEDTLGTNQGTPYYFPAQSFIETIPEGTLDLP